MSTESNETICPLCREENGCMAHSEERCWCSDVTVPQTLVDLVPEVQQGQVCICRPCIEKFNDNPVEFVAKLRK